MSDGVVTILFILVIAFFIIRDILNIDDDTDQHFPSC